MTIDPSYVGRRIKPHCYELTVSPDICTRQPRQSQHCCITSLLLFPYISSYTGNPLEIASIERTHLLDRLCTVAVDHLRRVHFNHTDMWCRFPSSFRLSMLVASWDIPAHLVAIRQCAPVLTFRTRAASRHSLSVSRLEVRGVTTFEKSHRSRGTGTQEPDVQSYRYTYRKDTHICFHHRSRSNAVCWGAICAPTRYLAYMMDEIEVIICDLSTVMYQK